MIESRKNRLIKDIRRLRRSKGDRALLEGPHLVAEALSSGIEIEAVIATAEFLGSAERSLIGALERPPLEVSPTLLAQITDADSPRGILAIARLPRHGCEALPRQAAGLYVYVAGLQDPGNLGAIARSAEAVGVSGLVLGPGTVHPNHPRALRASAGSLLRLAVAVDAKPDDLEDHLADLGPTWVALASAGGRDLFAATPSPPLVLAVGAERGLPAAVASRCRLTLTIPMVGRVESLNTAVAVALALFEIRRRETAPPVS